jgi:predicted site-specific integrase-resolvase
MKIPLTTWAQRHYNPAPSPFTLRKWAREGQIHPAPEKVGRDWFVDESAKRLASAAPRTSLVDRLRAA